MTDRPRPTGFPITGIKFARATARVFYAGTAIKPFIERNNRGSIEGHRLVTDGGRVLGITAVEGILPFAMEVAYGAASFINFQGKYYRPDIGQRALLRYLASHPETSSG